TLIVTFGALILGVVIGFLVAIIRSTYEKTKKLKILNFICNIYITVIRGTPVVVQLLIIYYVVFGSVKIDKVLVAVLAFGLNSGAYV
ncbi:ABC transporter permease subunit, partial [Vibrio parahaemolyticus]|uniref:ABC transporter permease subunit n=1 Tax=Vibrio parahaemolyticus TaxID=670 RepID=UPI0021127155